MVLTSSGGGGGGGISSDNISQQTVINDLVPSKLSIMLGRSKLLYRPSAGYNTIINQHPRMSYSLL